MGARRCIFTCNIQYIARTTFQGRNTYATKPIQPYTADNGTLRRIKKKALYTTVYTLASWRHLSSFSLISPPRNLKRPIFSNRRYFKQIQKNPPRGIRKWSVAAACTHATTLCALGKFMTLRGERGIARRPPMAAACSRLWHRGGVFFRRYETRGALASLLSPIDEVL